MQKMTLLLVLALAAPAASQPAPASPAAILAAAREAAGGDAWSSIQTIHVLATSATGGSPHQVERWEDVRSGRFAKVATRTSFTEANGFDGVEPWRLGISGISYVLGDLDAERGAADESYRVARAWWFVDRAPATTTGLGQRLIEDRSADGLEITPEGGRPFQAWFDRDTHLLVRTEEQQAEGPLVTIYADYRKVGGIMLPFRTRAGDGSDPASDEVETVSSFEFNQAVREEQYMMPPKALAAIALPSGRASVDVPFRLTPDNRIIVALSIDNRITVDAEFDSGGGLILPPTAVARAGLTADEKLAETGGGAGSTIIGAGRLSNIAIGGARISDLAFKSFLLNPDAPDEALIGEEILHRFVVRLDFDKNIMTLIDPARFVYRGNGSIVPFHFQDNQPEVFGSVDGVAGRFAIDTGDNGSLLLIAPFASRYDLVDKYKANLPYEGRSLTTTRGVWARRRVQTVSFDGLDGRPVAQVSRPITRISLQKSGFDASRAVSANIGLGILKRFNVTFDYERYRLILEPNRAFAEPDVYNRSGLRLKRNGSVWTVTSIFDRSPASDAGLHVGDNVATIDGDGPERLDADQLAGKLKGPVGTKLVIIVPSNKGSKRVELTLADVI